MMESSNFEKYLAGVPLNPELAALKAGRLPEFGMLMQQGATIAEPRAATDPERELTREEKIALREMRLSAGWPVLQKLLEKSTITHAKAATALSQEHPMSGEIGQVWLAVRTWKQVVNELNWSVAVQVQAIEEEMQQGAPEEEI
jgi:hypothetical protein